MKNDVILLKKLIADTENDSIAWTMKDSNKIGYKSYYKRWKGEKKLTDNKRMVFTLSYRPDDYSICELKVFFVNDSLKTKDLIFKIDPWFFNFKTLKNIKKLIKSLEEKEGVRVKKGLDLLRNAIKALDKI